MPKLSLLLAAILIAGLLAWVVAMVRRVWERRRMELQSIAPEDLYRLLHSQEGVLLFDVRQPLDLLANSEIIPGAQRISPREVMANPSLIPSEKDSVVYCTCPSDRTSRAIARKGHAEKFFHVKFLRGGLSAWKAMGYPVEQYEKSFRLDTES